MDYYDYNVVNAGAAPGSYLGMDPAFLVWIPPLDETGEILPQPDNEYADIKPKQYIDPGSNQESPEQELSLPKNRALSMSDSKLKYSPVMHQKINRIHPFNDNKPSSKHDNNKIVSIQLHEFPKVKLGSPVRVHKEKETKVEKSPTIDSNILDDIKFADDDTPEDQCNIESYQDNLLSSS